MASHVDIRPAPTRPAPNAAPVRLAQNAAPICPAPNAASKESVPDVWAPVLEQGLFTPKKMRVVTAGAGHSGLIMAYKMRHEVKCESFVEHVIYEKNVGSIDSPLTLSDP